jgi:lipoprotein NlpI
MKSGLVNAYYYRGGSYLNLGLYSKAAADFSKIAELEPANYTALGKLGMCLYIVSDSKEGYANAEKIFKKALKLNPSGKYLPLWIYLSARKQGKSDKAVLTKALSKMPEKEWMANIYSLYLNKISPSQCLLAAGKHPENKREGMKCEALFYIAEFFLNNGDPKRAAEYFRKCAKTKAENYLEHMMAKVELEKLKKQKN